MNIDDNGFINLSNGLAECKISLWGSYFCRVFLVLVMSTHFTHFT